MSDFHIPPIENEHSERELPLSMLLDACIKCNICTSYCPISAVTDKFPGPKYVGPQAQRYRREDRKQSPDHWVDYCSACRVCNEVCPQGVKIAEINSRAKAQIVKDKGLPIRNWFLGRNATLAKIGSYAPSLANLGLHNPFSRFMAEKVMGIARHAPLPHWSTEGTLADWLERTRGERLKSDKKVAYFHGCSTMYYEPAVGICAIAVMEHLGYEVIVPPQNCCGLPMLNNGDFKGGEKLYRSNVMKLLPYADAGLPIVGTSVSCVLTVRDEAAEMLQIHDEESRRLKLATWDMCEWLNDLSQRGELRTDFRPLNMVVPYHPSCQMRGHRIGKPAVEVLSLIPGLDVREGHARCCGLAGTYGYKVEKYDIAMKVGAEAFGFIEDLGPWVRYVAADSEICRWQLEHGTHRELRHPVEFLAAAYGLWDLDSRQLIAEPSPLPAATRTAEAA